MTDRSAIEWTDATWNPVRARHPATGRVGHHCEHVSEGCRNCYAERMNRWRGTGWPYKPGAVTAPDGEIEIFLDERALAAPLRWRRPRSIFVCSMTDLFAGFVTDAMLDRVFAVMALCPQHTFQVLTKRPERMRAWCERNRTGGWIFHVAAEVDPAGFGARSGRWPLPNVWLGTSVEDQATADARIPHLLATPAAVRWVSAEPLLGPVDFDSAWHGEDALESECWGDCLWCKNGRPPLHNCQLGRGDWERGRSGLDWVVVGGESGPGARPMHPTWPRTIRNQCVAAGVPFFFKQWGEWVGLRDPGDGEWPTDAGGFIRLTYSGERHDGGWPMQRVGKRHAGRLLDGITHDAWPEAAHAG